MIFFLIIMIVIVTIIIIRAQKYKELEVEVLRELGFANWYSIPYFDAHITVKSRQALEKYDDVKYFKENREKLVSAEDVIKRKNNIATTLKSFLENNEYKSRSQYDKITRQIGEVLRNTGAYRIKVDYISSAGNI